MVRLFDQTDHWYGFQPSDVWTLFHSCAFDFSVWEIWGALLYGGKVVVVPYWVSRSPEAFAELLRRERVTVLNQTPSAFRQLTPFVLAGINPAEQTLRYVIFGGEALELASLLPWMEQYGDSKPAVDQHVRHHGNHRACDLPADHIQRSARRIGQPDWRTDS